MILERVAELLSSKGLTLALAESCTGGMISHMITDLPGASRYFMASIVTYSDSSKMSLLGVKEGTLIEHGAVSAEVAAEMAIGVRELVGSDIGLSATGIAGPGGATEEKPVGLVHFALSTGGILRTDSKVFSGDREQVRRAASKYAMGLILETLG